MRFITIKAISAISGKIGEILTMIIIITAVLLLPAALSAASGESVGIRGGGTAIGSRLLNNYLEEDYEDGPCLNSFPLASSDSLNKLPVLPVESYSSYIELTEDERHLQSSQHRRNLSVLLPNDETRTSYAPLCNDGKHIDIRKLLRCLL